MNDPFFSIIIPTLNEENYLPRLLNNLKNQKEKSFEVIIVDSHSEDKTKEVALNFHRYFPLRFFENERKSVAFQRNFGARKAKGKYLVFIDADNGVSPGFLSRLRKVITNKKGLLFLPAVSPYENETQAKVIFPLINFLIESSQNLGRPFSTGGSMIIEKYFFHLIGGFDEKLFISEDHDLVQRAFDWGVRAKFLRDIKFKFSLRRMKKEGQLTLFYKYLVAAAHVLLKKQLKKKVFDYEMGGQFYKKNKQKQDFNIIIKTSLAQIRHFFKEILKEK